MLIDRLGCAAQCRPNAAFLDGQRLTCAEAWARTGAVASWLIAKGYGPGRAPIALLSCESLERALLVLGAWRAGAVVASVSPALTDHMLSIIEPALVFTQEGLPFEAALTSAAKKRASIVTVDGKRGLAFGALTSCSIDAAVAERRLHITADTPARILFTAGPSGLPEGVLTTHGELRNEDLT
jgi:feruloyl-CoA synthase